MVGDEVVRDGSTPSTTMYGTDGARLLTRPPSSPGGEKMRMWHTASSHLMLFLLVVALCSGCAIGGQAQLR